MNQTLSPSKTTYFGIKNLVTSDVLPIQHPDQKAAVYTIPSSLETKADRRVWSNRPDTEHLFISGYEAVNPNLRVNPRQGNPAHKLHALIVDYDAYAPSHGTVQELINREYRSELGLVPSWIVVSRSDKRRLIWELAEPICLDAPRFTDELIRLLMRELRLPNLLAGLDEPALKNPATYYEIGEGWVRFNPYPLAKSFVQNLFAEAVELSSKRHQNTGGIPEVPMEEVHDEIEAKFPGRLGVAKADFKPGVRGPAVWDPSASNPTSCVYYKHGVYRYSSDKIFHSYREILGDSFVRKFERERIGTAIENLYYFGKGQFCRVWEADNERRFTRYNKDEVKDYLKVTWGLNPKKSNEAGGSEIDRAVQIVHEIRTVAGMAPFLWNPNLLVESNGDAYLNCSNTRVLPPAERMEGTTYRWGEGFEWTSKWLIDLFEPRSQLLRMLAWMQRAYRAGLQFSPSRSLALFLVGSTNLGKTLWNQIWWPYLMGGGTEATSYLINGGGFNKSLASTPHWFVDDARASSTEKDMQTFTETIKAFIANPTITYRPMYVDGISIDYSGTVCITMNEDDMSLQMLPSLDRSVKDKVLVLLCANREDKPTVFQRFAAERGNDAIFSEQLKLEAPAFLRWLLQWNPPKGVMGGPASRFGVADYVHPSLLRASIVNSSAGDLQAVIDLLFEHEAVVQDEVKKQGYYECSALDLLHLIQCNPVTQKLLGSFGNSARGVGIRLAKLAKLSATRVANMRMVHKQTRYKGEATRYRLFPPSE